MTQNLQTQQSVRQYFAQLALFGKSRAVLKQWPALTVDSFFLALKLPESFINRQRQECGAASLPLGVLFANVRWS